MKICLFALNSSYVHTNLAVRCLAKALRESGYEVSISEHTLKDRRDAVLYGLYSEKADIYGFSCYIWNITDMCGYASALKSIRPDAKIIFGGPEVSYEDESFFASHEYCDYLIRGEGEDAIVRLCGDISSDAAISRVYDGGAYGGFEGAGILYDEEQTGRIAYYESSRGCPFGCAFCLSSVSDGVRFKSAELTLAELRKFERFPDIKIVKFVDRTFNADRGRAKKIWRGLLTDEYTLSYHFEICASLLDEESFEILSQFPQGKIQLEIGIQSTNRETLNAINRRDDSEKAIASALRIKQAGNIHVHCDLIAGLPHEGYTRFKRSFDDIYGCCDMLQLGFLKLLKGCSLRRDAPLYGIEFERTPPYTVLKTADISYEELYSLKCISALLERVENSGSFAMSVKYLTAEKSPFEVFEELNMFIAEIDGRGISDIPQSRLFELLYGFAKRREDIDEVVFRSCLRFDYLSRELRILPEFLRSPEYDARAAGEFEKLRADRSEAGKAAFSNAEEPRMFEFDPGNLYLFDKKTRRYRIYRL